MTQCRTFKYPAVAQAQRAGMVGRSEIKLCMRARAHGGRGSSSSARAVSPHPVPCVTPCCAQSAVSRAPTSVCSMRMCVLNAHAQRACQGGENLSRGAAADEVQHTCGWAAWPRQLSPCCARETSHNSQSSTLTACCGGRSNGVGDKGRSAQRQLASVGCGAAPIATWHMRGVSTLSVCETCRQTPWALSYWQQ